MSSLFRLCQFVTFFKPGDAISGQAIAMHKAMQAMGLTESLLFTPAEQETESITTQAIDNYQPRSNDVMVLHYGARGPLEDQILGFPGRKFIYYHNVTPARFFARVRFPWVDNLRYARESLPELAHLGALAVSEYNKQELLRFGFQNVTVLPLILDFEGFTQVIERQKPTELLGKSLSADSINWLHVGRIVPNKRIEDIIRAFYVYHTQLNPNSHLFVAGSNSESDLYSEALATWVEKLDLQDAISFTGKVSQEELFDFYKLADLYVCMSEHEGFCIPLVEAMLSQVPIIAFRSTAVTDTMGQAGVLVNEKDPVVIAKIADLVLNKPTYRQRLIESQLIQAKQWHSDRALQALQNWLATLSH
ncbi:MAG: glycosyltransferase [Ardenticatenaceae bacterium]